MYGFQRCPLLACISHVFLRMPLQYGFPLPQDFLFAIVCCPCAIIQQRADVFAGYRRRRDKVVEVKPIQPRMDLVEEDMRWGIKRFIPGQITLADGSLHGGVVSRVSTQSCVELPPPQIGW